MLSLTYYVNRKENIKIIIITVQMEKAGKIIKVIKKKDCRNALAKIRFCFQSWNVISEKKIEIHTVLKATV